MVHQIAPSAFKMKKGGGHIFQLSLICTLKAIEVIKKVKKRKKDWVIELRQINTLCALDWCEPLIQRDHNALSALEASQISPKLPALTAPINSDQINYATYSENQYSNVRRSKNLSDKFRRLSISAQ